MFEGKEGREGHTLSVDIRRIVPISNYQDNVHEAQEGREGYTLSVDIRMIVPISDYQDCVLGAGGQGRTYTQC